jgi:hypothetical protein
MDKLPNARKIKARLDGIFAGMAKTVLLSDQRLGVERLPLRGYLTKGSGPKAGPEFRFQEAVAELGVGALLRLESGPERWKVTAVRQEVMDGELLFVSAQVERLDASTPPEPPAEIHELLSALARMLENSTLGPLEAADVHEALGRLPSLVDQPAEPGRALRIRERLALLKDRFMNCPQTARAAKGLILRLEAQLKRKGLP